MKIKDLDKHAGYSPGFGPLRSVMEWLESALKCPAFSWDGDQRAAAEVAVKDARLILDAYIPQEPVQGFDGLFSALRYNFQSYEAYAKINGNATADMDRIRGDIQKLITAIQATPLSLSEQRAVLQDPAGIICLLNRHDAWIVEADARDMDECVPSHERRVAELLAIGRAVIAEDPECFEESVRAEFKLRHGELTADFSSTAILTRPGEDLIEKVQDARAV